MALQFILGRSGTGKTSHCIEEIKKSVKENPLGTSIIYICPEQMTFQIERKLARETGSIRANVFSFTRLAWKVFQEVGGITRIHLEQQAIEMMLRKVVEQCKEELHMYQRAIDQSGFYTHLSQMISEFKRYQLQAEDIHSLSSQMESELLQLKLHDLAMIYEKYTEAIRGKYLDSEDYFALLVERIPQSDFLKDATIYIDGFYSFSPQELEIILALQKVCKEMKIVLPMQPFETKEYALFHLTGKTYDTLIRLTSENGMDIQEALVFSKPKRYQSQNIRHVEAYFERRPLIPSYEQEGIEFFLCANLRVEVEKIAREICRLVREEGVRYQNIAIIGRNIPEYLDLIGITFKDYGIPFHSDEKKKMIHHPFLEFILATFDTVESNWRLDAVFRMLKTGLFLDLSLEDIDILENYCLAYGIKGSKWTQQQPWKYGRYQGVKTDAEIKRENMLRSLREKITTPVVQLQKRLKKANTVRDMCIALYQYIEEIYLAKKIATLATEAEAQGELLKAKEYVQSWEKVMGLLDQLVEMLGDEKLSISTFIKMLRTGLEGLEFSNVPSSLDQVIVASIDHSRIEDASHVFFVGINEGVIPSVGKEDSMLSDEERENLQQVGVEINPTGKQQLLDEEFVFYMATVRPSHRAYLSCPLADNEGNNLFPSVFYKRLKEMFPTTQERYITDDMFTTGEGEMDLVTRKIPTFSLLVGKLFLYKEKKMPMDFWWDVYNYYIQDENKAFYHHILTGLFYKNDTKILKKEVSEALYGEEITGSVSRIEQFNRCAYAHFANYGLRLTERELYHLEAPDIGQLFHDALKKVTDVLLENKYSWADVTREMCLKLAEQAIEELAPKIQREILLSSNRYQYIKHKLQQIIYRATVILAEQGRRSDFTPLGLEVPFGKDKKMPSLHFALPNGKKMDLVGQIDRIDTAESEKGTLLRIVDYKSTGKALDLSEVYYGLALQMLTYLDVAVTHSKTWIQKEVTPVGVLYFHVHNPILDVSKLMKGELPNEATIEQELLKRFKMKGLVLADKETVGLMDTTLGNQSSDIISVSLKKDGTFSANSQVATLEEFEKLTAHVRQSYVDVGTKITEGEIGIEPYKYKNRTPCGFCSYKSVCQFDDTLGANKYRVLKPYKRNEVLALLDEKEEELSSEHSTEAE